jgi:hypothetical protein
MLAYPSCAVLIKLSPILRYPVNFINLSSGVYPKKSGREAASTMAPLVPANATALSFK